jgi:hypothetical protein
LRERLNSRMIRVLENNEYFLSNQTVCVREREVVV